MESRSSDDPATRRRHYAGWTANRDDAVLRADGTYEVRGSIEAVPMIGNGRTGVEVDWPVDGEIEGP